MWWLWHNIKVKKKTYTINNNFKLHKKWPLYKRKTQRKKTETDHCHNVHLIYIVSQCSEKIAIVITKSPGIN